MAIALARDLSNMNMGTREVYSHGDVYDFRMAGAMCCSYQRMAICKEFFCPGRPAGSVSQHMVSTKGINAYTRLMLPSGQWLCYRSANGGTSDGDQLQAAFGYVPKEGLAQYPTTLQTN